MTSFSAQLFEIASREQPEAKLSEFDNAIHMLKDALMKRGTAREMVSCIYFVHDTTQKYTYGRKELPGVFMSLSHKDAIIKWLKEEKFVIVQYFGISLDGNNYATEGIGIEWNKGPGKYVPIKFDDISEMSRYADK